MVSPLSSLGHSDIDLPKTSALKSNHRPPVPGTSFEEQLRAALVIQHPYPPSQNPASPSGATGNLNLSDLLVASGEINGGSQDHSQKRPRKQPDPKSQEKKAA